MFRGATNLSMDAKGRLVVPAKHRDALFAQCEGDIVLTAHPHSCLLLYPKPAWEPIQAKIMALSSFDEQLSSLQRLLVGHAEDLALDNAGRMLVSPVLREFAGFEKDVMLVGQGSHFELWNMEAWHKQLSNVVGNIKLPVELDGFSL